MHSHSQFQFKGVTLHIVIIGIVRTTTVPALKPEHVSLASSTPVMNSTPTAMSMRASVRTFVNNITAMTAITVTMVIQASIPRPHNRMMSLCAPTNFQYLSPNQSSFLLGDEHLVGGLDVEGVIPAVDHRQGGIHTEHVG